MATIETEETKAPNPEVAQVPVRRVPPNSMFLKMHMADGELPDGREFSLGASGASLVLYVGHHDGKSAGTYYTVSGREVIEALLAKGELS